MTSSSSSQPVHILDVLRSFPSPATSLDVYSHYQDDSIPRPEPYVRRSSPTPSSTISSYHSELGLRRGRTRDIHPDDEDATSPRTSSFVSTAQTSLRYSNPSPDLPSKAKDRPILSVEEDEGQRSQRHSIMEHEEVVLALDACRFHAGDRLPADPFWRPRWEMANVHVALWNGLEQVYLHAPHITIDRLAFSRYASAVIHAIETHHDIEEEYFFPLLEVSVSMQNNLEQHASFDDGIRALKFYLKSCINDPSIFDSETVLAIIDTFAIELATHFADELETLDPNVLRESFSVSDLDKQGASLQKHIVKDYKRHLYTALPVLIVNTPPGREWPLFSSLVKRILLPLILGRKYKTSWQYGKWPGQLNVFGNARSATMSFVPLPTISGSSSQVAESVSSGSMTATTQRNTPIPKSARSIKRQKAEEAFRGVRTAAVTPTGNELARAPVEKVQGRGQ